MLLKSWNGSAYVDVAGIRAGADKVPARRALLWTGFSYREMWRSTAPWRVIKNGRYTPTTGGADLVIPNWFPVDGYPDTTHPNGLLVPRDATVTVRAQVTRTVSTNNTWGLSLTKNGTVILALTNAPNSASTFTVSVPNVAVSAGDVLSVQIRTSVAAWGVVESGAVTYLEAV